MGTILILLSIGLIALFSGLWCIGIDNGTEIDWETEYDGYWEEGL